MMTHLPSNEQHIPQKVQMIKKEASDTTSTCQNERNVTLPKPWQRTMAPSSFFSSGSVPSNYGPPRVIRSEESTREINTNASEPYDNVETTTSAIATQSFNYNTLAKPDTTTSQRNVQPSKPRKTKDANFPSFKRTWVSSGQKEHDTVLQQRIKEWKEKQAMWQSIRDMQTNPAFTLTTPRFAPPQDMTDLNPYSYETNQYPMLAENNLYYTTATGNVNTIGESSRAVSTVVTSYEAREPVIKEVVSLAGTKEHREIETVTSIGESRCKRARLSLDDCSSLDKHDSSGSGTSETDDSPSTGKYISDLAQPFSNIPDDHQVAHINGLMSLPSNRDTRYGITYGELKRRCNPPESLTRVDLVAYVRHSKSSGRNLLDKYRIVSSNRTAKPTVLSKMCENEARVLGDGILRMNCDYFPGELLAQTAAARLKKPVRSTREGQKKDENETRKTEINKRMYDIEITRSMLKEIYDLLLSEKDRDEMKQFELASHTFGTANLMNHLTLFDRFFEDYQTSLTIYKKK